MGHKRTPKKSKRYLTQIERENIRVQKTYFAKSYGEVSVVTKQENEDSFVYVANMPQNFFFYPPQFFTHKNYDIWAIKARTRLRP